MSDVNINSCKSQVERIKNNIDGCFAACNAKGSSYVESARNTSELFRKIQAIPSLNGVASNGPIPFTYPFIVTVDNPEQNGLDIAEYDFSNIGVNWNGFVCFSATNPGWIIVYKLSSTHCCISSLLIDGAKLPEIDGNWVVCCGTYRFRYVINGNKITFIRDPYYNTEDYLISSEYPSWDGICEMMSDASMTNLHTPEDIAEYWARTFELIHIF